MRESKGIQITGERVKGDSKCVYVCVCSIAMCVS